MARHCAADELCVECDPSLCHLSVSLEWPDVSHRVRPFYRPPWPPPPGCPCSGSDACAEGVLARAEVGRYRPRASLVRECALRTSPLRRRSGPASFCQGAGAVSYTTASSAARAPTIPLGRPRGRRSVVKCFSAQSVASLSTGLIAADRAASSASMGTLSLTSLSPLELDDVSDSKCLSKITLSPGSWL